MKKKTKAQKQAERQQYLDECEFMNGLEADLDKPWKGGVWNREQNEPRTIFASADTEAESERYMTLRHKHSGSIPHRLTDEVGWWEDKEGLNAQEET